MYIKLNFTFDRSAQGGKSAEHEHEHGKMSIAYLPAYFFIGIVLLSVPISTLYVHVLGNAPSADEVPCQRASSRTAFGRSPRSA